MVSKSGMMSINRVTPSVATKLTSKNGFPKKQKKKILFLNYTNLSACLVVINEKN